jgi:tRNA(Arg) A34 adenosine deaminase TadA
VYSTSDPYGGGCGIVHAPDLPVRHKNHPLEVIGGVLEKETTQLFKEFIQLNTSEFYSEKNRENPFIKHLLD